MHPFKVFVKNLIQFLIHVIFYICDALRDLVPFVQFKKRKNNHGGILLLVSLQIY